MTKSKIPSLALQTLFQALSWSLGANTSLFPKFHPNLKIPRRNPIKFYLNSNLEASLNFHSKFTWNMENSYGESSSSLQTIQNRILFQFFRARKGPFWIGQSLEKKWIYLNCLNFESNSNSFDCTPLLCHGAHRPATFLPCFTVCPNHCALLPALG
jgi:hypothetical protein